MTGRATNLRQALEAEQTWWEDLVGLTEGNYAWEDIAKKRLAAIRATLRADDDAQTAEPIDRCEACGAAVEPA